VPAVVDPDLFHQLIQDNKEDNPCTASNKAFTLLLLENNCNNWVDIYDKNAGIQCDSDIKPNYTTSGGIKFSNDKESPKAKGWSSKGIECFNPLFKWVKYKVQ
jgi:hypothetical protein